MSQCVQHGDVYEDAKEFKTVLTRSLPTESSFDNLDFVTLPVSLNSEG
jgi:hypothetical protein